IQLPLDSFLLDGSGSTDPNGEIVAFKWTKLSWRGTITLTNPSQPKTSIKNLVSGIFHFELSVTDTDGYISRDTIEVRVSRANNCDRANRQVIKARLKEIG